jgi:uncharacterized SAM-binding protein YcdF (DUF218 family)
MFLFKKIIAPLCLPLTFSLLILIFGFIFLHFRRKQRRGRFFVFWGIVLLLLFSYGFTSGLLLRSLETRYPPLSAEALVAAKDVQWIAVLGGGQIDSPRLPATSRLSEATAARLIEAVRLHRELPESRLILSGGAVFTASSEAKTMAEAAPNFGIKAKDIILEAQSRDTEEEAIKIREITGKDRFILVTSAAHMPRSMALFRKAGLDPIPAPAHFLALERPGKIAPRNFYPSADGLRQSEIAVYEYLGLLWAKIRGKI